MVWAAQNWNKHWKAPTYAFKEVNAKLLYYFEKKMLQVAVDSL